MRREPFLAVRLGAAARRGEALRARQQERFDGALRWVAGDPRGRLLLWELMARSNWLASRLAQAATADWPAPSSDTSP